MDKRIDQSPEIAIESPHDLFKALKKLVEPYRGDPRVQREGHGDGSFIFRGKGVRLNIEFDPNGVMVYSHGGVNDINWQLGEEKNDMAFEEEGDEPTIWTLRGGHKGTIMDDSEVQGLYDELVVWLELYEEDLKEILPLEEKRKAIENVLTSSETVFVPNKKDEGQITAPNYYGWSWGSIKRNNQDTFGFNNENGVMAVADGVGSSTFPLRAAGLAIGTIVQLEASDDLKKELKEAAKVSHQFYTSSLAVVVTARTLELLSDGELIEIASLGDARARVFNEGKVLYRNPMQTPHGKVLEEVKDRKKKLKWAQYILQQGRIEGNLDPETMQEAVRIIYELTNAEGRNVHSFPPYVDHIHTDQVFCPKGSVISLESDGAAETVSDVEQAQLFNELPFEEACAELKRRIQERHDQLSRIPWKPKADQVYPMTQIGVDQSGAPIKLRIGQVSPKGESKSGTDHSTFLARKIV